MEQNIEDLCRHIVISSLALAHYKLLNDNLDQFQVFRL